MTRTRTGSVVRWTGRAALGVGVLGIGAVVGLDTQPGHRLVIRQIEGLRPASGLRIAIGRIDGSLFNTTVLRDVRLSAPNGVFLRVAEARMAWEPLDLLANRLTVHDLSAPTAAVLRPPRFVPSATPQPILPNLAITVDRLRIDRLTVARGVAGPERSGRLALSGSAVDGRLVVNGQAILADGGDRLTVRMDGRPDGDRFRLAATLFAPAGGVAATRLGLSGPSAFAITAAGRWTDWRGTAALVQPGATVADLSLSAAADRYRVRGTLDPSSRLRGRLARFVGRRVVVEGEGVWRAGTITGSGRVGVPAGTLRVTGGVDVTAQVFRDLRLEAAIARPQLLVPAARARNLRLDARLDGAIPRAAFAWRLRADTLAVDRALVTGLVATGAGRLSDPPFATSMQATARSVTGVDEDLDRILRDVRLSGPVSLSAERLVASDLRLTAPDLVAKVGLRVDLASGRYDAAVAAELARFVLPGLGEVAVGGDLRLVPDGAGFRYSGPGRVRFRRLDNPFLLSLTRGLPSATARIERGGDKIVRFSDLQLTSPGLTLSGAGLRRPDGRFEFTGVGRSAEYGPITRLVLSGRPDRPRVEMTLAAPVSGVTAVELALEPSAAGYALAATGGSPLGPFAADGAVELAPGRDTTVRLDRLAVAGTVGQGRVTLTDGRLDGRIAFAGGGLAGTVGLRPQPGGPGDSIGQGVAIAATARDATLPQLGLSVARGEATAELVLADGVRSLSGSATGEGVRVGGVSLAELAATADIRDGRGTVVASASGRSAGRFELSARAALDGSVARIDGGGTVGGEALALNQPVTVTRSADGYEVTGLDLTFGGGAARADAFVGPGVNTLAAELDRLPLRLLDLALPELGLGGTISGTARYGPAAAGGSPEGALDLTVAGLTRSTIARSSAPLDLAVAARLEGSVAGLRAVAGDGTGAVLGRGQLSLTGVPDTGSLAERLTAAALRAQLRYNGPVGTLWRLGGVELFDLTGPVAIGADVEGTLGEPVLAGSFESDGARLTSAVTGTTIRDLAASGRFDGSRLLLDRFAGRTGSGRDAGTVAGEGSVELALSRGIGFDLTVRADGATLIDRDDLGATVTGPLRLRSAGGGGSIEGDVRLDRSRYRLGRATQGEPVPELNVTEVNGAADALANERPAAAPWSLAIRADAPSRLAVTGLGLNSEWSAGLTLGGTLAEPRITGQADLIRGEVDFAGQSFALERGIIGFSGQSPANPTLDIVARADVDDLDAQILVRGRGLSPEISFASTPALPEDELLSRLLFGGSITDLSAIEAVQLGAAVASLQDGGNGLNPINALRDAAGLDRLRVLPADVTQGRGTAIAAGKYLTRRAFVEVVTDGQGYSATQLEYRVFRWLSVLSTLSTIGRQSAAMRVSKDY